jgi:hypothetical protein
MSAAQTQQRPMTEAQLQRHVEHAARQLGYRTYHTWNSMRSEPGFPDLICIRMTRLIVAELKRDGKKPTKVQDDWLFAFEHVGAEVYVWRPADWKSGEIARILAEQETQS